MDILDFLDEYSIEYWTEGKNVSHGWINITCLFCDDNSNHLGIRLKDFRVFCWRCGGHSITHLVSKIADISTQEAKRVIKTLGVEDIDLAPPLSNTSSEEVKRNVSISLPQESTIHFPKFHIEYLRKRGFPPRKTIRKYKLRAVHNLGKYKFRIIIPVFIDRRLVSFTARDITGQQEPPYKMASKKECLLDRKDLIFNLDTVDVGGDAILVEGPMDAMKMGDGAICSFGTQVNLGQILLLKKKNIRRLFILFDNPRKDKGAGKRAAKRLGPQLAPLVKKRVEILTLEKALDPGELTIEEARAIKADLGFTI